MNAAAENESILRRFDFIRDDVARLVSKDTELQDRIKQLEIDLDVYKRIFSQTNAEKKLLEDENEMLKEISEKQQWQRGSLQKQTQASRVVVLLDGDGAIFTPQLIALGQSGGHQAAIKLSDSIKDHILSLDEIDQFQLSVFVFFNKKGLFDTFYRCSFHSAKARLDDFVAGFNQASDRFVMVDVGSGKEAADSKIKHF
ncbi:hypothetical protein AGABI2DRAFT_191961 [Agaricus bisporus var. bisporus H97]|uniref:hypothetical protein n=1 Tax=Agaricus bisporus var. bisporus (strain H97 / ATCC MYA-4626 / FGSC 10389) TaxID=936046 RepID=UPI00029F57B2|nr:hypothetical protein AGABI2DRAFT_191961 [Agaricus bisporus var. bisporus H97]EKV48334.1 hypothetical protein AGABI2DRAFT_191961 [Agaricus bisporus var. bisporus H97]